MIEEAWKDLDDEIIKCKVFEDSHRGTFVHVKVDLARLSEQISHLGSKHMLVCQASRIQALRNIQDDVELQHSGHVQASWALSLLRYACILCSP